MTNMLKMGLLTIGVGMAFYSAQSSAAVATYNSYSNAVNYCQAFTPGIQNTIRNRVIGSENVGTAPIAVACNFDVVDNGAVGQTYLHDIAVFFSNSTAADATVSCTLLTGTSGGIDAGAAYTVTREVVVPAGAANVTFWDVSDNPSAGATDFGSPLAGVNCILPPHVTLSATIHAWDADNGT